MSADLKPVLIIYKEIMAGDIEKLNERSNITQSGGGARDFRFNPEDLFIPVFQKLFPEVDKFGYLTGVLHWANYASTEVKIDINTTKVRKEVRICQVSKCLRNIPSVSENSIFILIKNTAGEVWPYFTTEEELIEEWNTDISRIIIDGLNAKRRKNTAAAGYIDLETGVNRTNGELR